MSEKKIESVVQSTNRESTREGYSPKNQTSPPPPPPQNFVPAGGNGNNK